MARNYYDVLGLSRWATDGMIEAAFREKTEVMHRVRAQEEKLDPAEARQSEATLEEHFREISEAYDVLSNAQKRKQYDDFLQRVQPPSPAEMRARTRRIRYIAWCVISGTIIVPSFYFGAPKGFGYRLWGYFIVACVMMLRVRIVGPPFPEERGWEYTDYLGLLVLWLFVSFILSVFLSFSPPK